MVRGKSNKGSFLNKVIYFFPLQLLLVHLKKNQQLLLFWLILFLAIFKQLGLKYGVPYLFLAPEYLGTVSFSSYLIVGFALGGFVIAFNISSYIMNGFRFPFLATLSKPFLKYSINNSIIPLGFIVSYLLLTYQFLAENEGFGFYEISYRLAGFLLGYLAFILISMFYFLATNKSFEKLFGKELSKVLRAETNDDAPAKILLNKKNKPWYQIKNFKKNWRVDSYINRRFQFKLTRSFAHYDKKMLSQVFRQNHINASIFQITILVSIVVLGIFRENDYFIIPASATLMLIFTMLLMFTSALRSWIRGWTVVLIIGLIIIVNQLSKYDNLYYENRAYGLDYSHLADYEASTRLSNTQIEQDVLKTKRVLEKWKAKHLESKPKAVFLAASGGGARAAFWSFLALQHLDSISNGELLNHTIMGTGSSGGMIGMAYFRELKLREQTEGLDPYNPSYQSDLAQDMLNPVAFTLAVNDALIRTQKFEFDGEYYGKDRAYTFEKTLNNNTHGFLNKRLGDYEEAVKEAKIPQLIFTPSVVNDGRRLIASSLPMSFLCNNNDGYKAENIDFQTLFKDNNPMNLRFSTLLRMNSSFPYILPTVSLPTNPKIDVFDSGLRDNYGIKTTLNYIFHIREWLEENTSGIVILQIRDGLKQKNKKKNTDKKGLISQLLSPFGSLYGNWFEVQDYNNDELLQYTKEWYSGEVDLINYQLNKSADNYISLSWHLTSKEKGQILNSIPLTQNQTEADKLLGLLNSGQ